MKNGNRSDAEKKNGFYSRLRERDGPLTQDLVLNPSNYGLGRVPTRLSPDRTTTVVCGYCSTGCGLNVHLKNGEAVNLTADTEYPVNLGMACPKGWEALAPLKAPDRGLMPRVRNKKGAWKDVGWDGAIKEFVGKTKGIISQYGRESFAYISTGQFVIEEMAFLGALAKFGMGIIHTDANTRQCMATAATAYKESFGFDAPPFTYADFEESDVIVLVGSNLCIAHPIMWQRICRNPHQPEIIVLDPRKTETAQVATQHYPLAPKSDLVLLYTISNLLIQNGWVDLGYIERSTDGFEIFRRKVEKFTLEYGASVTGLAQEDILKLARTIHEGKKVSFWWTMGVNQSYEGVRVAQAIINLALMTGNIGRPGTGANSITGQCNAMGSRLYSNTTNLLGGRDFLKPEHRRKVAEILGIDSGVIPDQNSMAYDQILEGIESGRIKGLWVIATNTSHSWIDQNRANGLLDKLEFLVVQDMYPNTETAQKAHLYLPAAGWGEKEGVFINSERRLGLCKKVSKAPGKSLSDFNIFKLISHYWGCESMFEKWSAPENVFQIIKEISRGQPCDITGIRDYRMIDEMGGIQWPFPECNIRFGKERRLFEDGVFYHENGKARIIFEEPRTPPESINGEFPFILLTGRGTSAQWHTQTRTGKSKVLQSLSPQELYVEMNPADAEALGIVPQEEIKVISRRGELKAKTHLTAIVQKGQLFMPMHYEEVNRLTHPSFDPYSRQPSYKACAVCVQKVASSVRGKSVHKKRVKL